MLYHNLCYYVICDYALFWPVRTLRIHEVRISQPEFLVDSPWGLGIPPLKLILILLLLLLQLLQQLLLLLLMLILILMIITIILVLIMIIMIMIMINQ